MSPEQYRRERVDAASDQFSFAVALWQAVYGHAPFRGDTFQARRAAVLAHELRPLDEARGREVPPRLHRALLRALADDPRERFPALTDLLSELSTAASPARRWSRVLAASGGALLLGAAVALGLAARSGRERPTFPAPVASASPGGDAPTPSRARTAVILLATDNQTGDARYDGVVEGAIEELVNASRKLDAYGVAVHDPDHRAVVTVRSAIARARASDDAAAGSVVVTLAPTDAVSGRALPVLRAIAAPGEPLMATLHRLSLDLRAELGDSITPAADEPVVMSESLEALHEWATGVGLGRAGDHAAAIPHLRRAIAADPSFAEAHATLASAIFNSSFVVEDAEKEVALALGGPARRMSTRRRMMTLAFSYGYQHRSAEQMSVVQQVLDFWPGDFPAEVLITTAAASAGERSLALEFARRAAADHPDAQIVHHNLLSALLHQELLPDAETEGEELLRRFPQSGAFSYALLAIVQTLLAEPDKASVTCDRLALVDPELADELRADMAAYAGKPDEAIALLHRQIDPAVARGDTEDVATEYAALAPLLVARGDRVRAKAALKVALGGEIDMQYDAARRLVAVGDEERAPAFVAGWSDATDPLARMYARLLRGDLLLQHGKIEDASASYRLALQIEDAWIVHARLADAALAAQDWKTAESELSICRARRGDGATALTPSLRLVRVVDEELALVRQHVVPAR
jgi:tetratricopeptide (TPR) repeat protein